jgi:hypothetical protein
VPVHLSATAHVGAASSSWLPTLSIDVRAALDVLLPIRLWDERSGGNRVKGLSVAALAAPMALTVLIGAGFSADVDTEVEAGVNAEALPPLARDLLPVLEGELHAHCPDLPALWVLAETQAESGWNPHAFSNAGAAGLLQLLPGTWVAVGGQGGAWPRSARPTERHPVWDPKTHLRVAVRWMCGNLRLVQAHLRTAAKPTEALDALAVCHVAGCSRVIGSATGVPTVGEAGCDVGCVRQVAGYLAAIHRWIRAFAGPMSVGHLGGSLPDRYAGGPSGCAVPDPTGTGGCVTQATAWLLAQVAAHVHQGPVTCWDAHAWNPSSDHPKGRACDYTIGRLGDFPRRADVLRGWALAEWLRTCAAALHVSYVIFQGRIWSLRRAREGWRPYSGGGVYDPTDPTGGHYDHVHVSLSE